MSYHDIRWHHMKKRVISWEQMYYVMKLSRGGKEFDLLQNTKRPDGVRGNKSTNQSNSGKHCKSKRDVRFCRGRIVKRDREFWKTKTTGGSKNISISRTTAERLKPLSQRKSINLYMRWANGNNHFLSLRGMSGISNREFSKNKSTNVQISWATRQDWYSFVLKY